jgi:hypothetical protein
MKDVSHHRITVDCMRLIGDREQDQREAKEGTEKKERKKVNRKYEPGNRIVKGSGMVGGGDCC